MSWNRAFAGFLLGVAFFAPFDANGQRVDRETEGRCFNLDGKASTEDALQACDTLLGALQSEIARLHAARGYIRVKDGDYEHALPDFDEAIRLDPSHINARRLRAFIYVRTNKNEAAIDDLNVVISLEPSDMAALSTRALAYRQIGDMAHAIEDFTTLIGMHYSEAGSYYFRGLSYQVMGDEERAKEDIDMARRLDPELIGRIEEAGTNF